ncbi:hypothetical protein BKA63DRAFT_229781 [Paraphoma chrysanthemicola]|nr:hypothetical protein BKA63DRAFT_229781 [Paraphoma chrysanthemicola]
MAAPYKYTIQLLGPSSLTEHYLFHLQQSALTPLWLGKYAVFFHKDNPSQRPWSHVQLFEGHNIKLPPECTTEQTWTFEIESEKAFVPDPIGEDVIQRDEWVDWSDGNSEDLLYLTLATHLMKPNEHTRRLCVLSFLSFDTDQAEARYRQHLDAVSEDSELGMRAQVCGQVGHNQQDLSTHATTPAGKKHQKKTKKWQPLNVSTDGPARIARPVNTNPGIYGVRGRRQHSFLSFRSHRQRSSAGIS